MTLRHVNKYCGILGWGGSHGVGCWGPERIRPMANYTLQLCSDSGSFGYPEGDDIRVATNKSDVSWFLDDWADKHERVGSDSGDAYAVVFMGKLDNVQDIYPDFIVRIGVRGGHRWEPA